MNVSDNQLFFGSLGALGALSGAMALRMSFYRVAGSPGEDKPNSPLNQMHERQQLHAEWAPLGAFLGLALFVKGTANKTHVAYLMALFTATRYVFAATAFLRRSKRMPVTMPAMIICYLTVFTQSALLIAA
jgi:hypothetical protein